MLLIKNSTECFNRIYKYISINQISIIWTYVFNQLQGYKPSPSGQGSRKTAKVDTVAEWPGPVHEPAWDEQHSIITNRSTANSTNPEWKQLVTKQFSNCSHFWPKASWKSALPHSCRTSYNSNLSIASKTSSALGRPQLSSGMSSF